jgi:hypothetical protein
MTDTSLQADQGKMAQLRLWARYGFYRTGRLRKLAHVQESPSGVELVLEHGNFFLGRAVIGGGSISQVRPEDKLAADLQNGDIIVLSSYIV